MSWGLFSGGTPNYGLRSCWQWRDLMLANVETTAITMENKKDDSIQTRMKILGRATELGFRNYERASKRTYHLYFTKPNLIKLSAVA